MSRVISYLACPYDDPNEVIRVSRVHAATKAAGALMVRFPDRIVYSPITHHDAIASFVPLPHSWVFWEKYCFGYLSAASDLIVLTLPGWEESVSVRGEMEIATAMGLPIYMLSRPHSKLVQFYTR